MQKVGISSIPSSVISYQFCFLFGSTPEYGHFTIFSSTDTDTETMYDYGYQRQPGGASQQREVRINISIKYIS
jgi:hypothetical protein